jgi:plasmid stabilization system protein ParE
LKGRVVRPKPGVRRLVHGTYLIYYRVEKDPPSVRVLRFWHGARDPKTPRL